MELEDEYLLRVKGFENVDEVINFLQEDKTYITGLAIVVGVSYSHIPIDFCLGEPHYVRGLVDRLGDRIQTEMVREDEEELCK